MWIRKRKPFELGRYLGPISTRRIHKLEEIKQQLLELDSRLKMEMVGLRELAGISVDFNDEITVFPKLSPVFASEIKPDCPSYEGPSSSHTLALPDVPPQSSVISDADHLTRSFLVAQYPDVSAVNSTDLDVDVDMDCDPVIIDITHQVPQKPGLHDSLEPEAFLKYASDLVGQTVPNKLAFKSVRVNTTQLPS